METHVTRRMSLAVEVRPSTRYQARVGLHAGDLRRAGTAPRLLSKRPRESMPPRFEAMEQPSATSDCDSLVPLPSEEGGGRIVLSDLHHGAETHGR